ncbi:hypothetical protein ACHRV6_23375 [Flavobacterium sp. FlaQc-51]|uniref:hypothetical protein n=1 Tax=Flavobacterium sp. FlaQc-51 TaxID=3374184 RepID=UPI0037580526
MKKLLFITLLLILTNCSSDNSEKDDTTSSKNSVELNGTKYRFDSVKITRDEDYSSVTFLVDIQDKSLTNRLVFSLYHPKNKSFPADYYYEIINTYTYNTYGPVLQAMYLMKYNSDKTYNIVAKETDFIGKSSRVLVTKNSDSNYTFDINFITTLGNITGSYSGEVTKVDFK